MGSVREDYKLIYEKSSDFEKYASLVGGEIPEGMGEFLYPVLVNGGMRWVGWQEIREYVDSECLEHLHNFFAPTVEKARSVLTILEHRVFRLESKFIYDAITVHGSSNYLLHTPIKEKVTLKMRGYESKKKHWTIIPDTLELIEGAPPSRDFLVDLTENREQVPVPKAKVKTLILKPGEYRKRNKRYRDTSITVGDNIYQVQLLKAYNRNTFTFRTAEQRKKFFTLLDRLEKHLGYSLEAAYMTEDGKIRYTRMLNDVYRSILEEEEPLIFRVIKNRNLKRDYRINEEYLLKKKIEEALDEKYGFEKFR